jgi:DNA uptake protein ComE-like DNA-binding protein
LKKIYGFSTLDYERIAPWVYIPIDEAVPVHRAESKSELPLPGQMEINKATATDLTHCGLSTATAWAVINYRDKLGGFYSREQFAEIKKLSDEEWQTLASCVRVDPTAIITLHINSAEFNQLANHPYLSDKFARAIIHYRDSTGIYRSVNELVRAYRVSPQYLEKLKFYLSL